MSRLGDNLWMKRLPDFEMVDKITIELVPRYKTSGLSGDEWRQSTMTQFWFKGLLVHEVCHGRLNAAIIMLGGDYIMLADNGIPDKVLELERWKCFQPTCTNAATHRWVLKKLFSDQGDALDMTDKGPMKYFRLFCDKHNTRGDCSREDSDDNYEEVRL